MDSKRFIIFIVLSALIMVGWQKFFAPPPPVQQQTASTPANNSAQPVPATPDASKLDSKQRVTVTTDVLRAVIDTQGADLRQLALLKYDSAVDPNKPFLLFNDQGGQVYVAQTGLLSNTIANLPTHKTIFTADKTAYTMTGDKLEVRLTAPETDGVKVSKIYTFTKGSYEINVRYEVTNNSGKPLNAQAYYRLLRDGKTPEGESRFVHTFTGPALYTPENKFEKITFADLDKGKAEYPQHAKSGWVAMIEHYFASAWILQPLDGKSVCTNAQDCTFSIRAQENGLYSAGVIVGLPALQSGATGNFAINLYAGPQEFNILSKVAEGLPLVKDYGLWHIFASPLFWWLTKLHSFVLNWGWAIVLLTLTVKLVLYPLTAASYRSMAKMRAVAPRLEALKKEYGDDRMKLQQAMMEMYKTEKINPLGGCLPIVIQMPVFLGLYWAILTSVELRQAPWIGWIHDLARPDPYFILPTLMAITMIAQTFLNPPPADPLQAKMMKIMPIAFSVMFFFFPAGLVLYWLVNNILSIAQQWHINRKIANAQKNPAHS